MSGDNLNKMAAMRTGPGGLHGVGRIVAYSSSPMYCIETLDGRMEWWSADLCELLPLAEDVSEDIWRWTYPRVKLNEEQSDD